jgi:hypothetical protein
VAVKRSKFQDRACKCGSALKHAIITNPRVVPAKNKKNLSAILAEYLA